ncbi:MAG: diguanylate cyclase, partial [bacterium]|nr:diguanylate cyclase [bacterium]
RMANSSSFGRPGQVSDIRQAVMTLGLRSVNLLALSFSLAAYEQSDDNRNRFDYTRYWTNSGVTTAASHVLARTHLPQYCDEAFLASILCDFGQLILAECVPTQYGKVVKRFAKGDKPLQAIEADILGGDHATIGGELLREWGLPPLICTAIQYHHDPNHADNTDSDARALASVLHVASAVANIFTGGDARSGAEALQQTAADAFGMEPSDCQALLEATEAEMSEIVEMLGLECSEPAQIAEIRMRATEHLVKQSLALNQQMEAVSADSAELKKRNTDLETRATTDALTGLRNRGHFDEWIESESQRAAQAGHPLGLLLLDIDHFKSVNDDYGHPCGDAMLKAVANAITEAASKSSIVCRYGGEEIAVICPDTDVEALTALADKLRKAVGEVSVPHDGDVVRRTVSVGGYGHPAGAAAISTGEMIELADAELYRAKSEGRNRVFVKHG